MARSLAARDNRSATVGSVATAGRPLAGRPADRARSSRAAQSAPARLSARARETLAGARALHAHRRVRIALIAMVLVLPLLGGGWLWLRSSPFVAVQDVQIVGVHGPEAAAVQAALEASARHMSTLDVNAGALTAAVASLRVVRSVAAIPRFPHGLELHVTEQLPVASLVAAGARTAVAADGVVLGPTLLSSSLPSVNGSVVPVPGHRVGAGHMLEDLAVLGAAPALLAKHVARAFTGTKGLTLAMRNGLLVYFGDAAAARAKWLSLARVLADASSTGASYVDVRLPSHPAAGFPAGVTPPDSASGLQGAGEQAGSAQSTVASLAARLSTGATGTSPAAQEPSSGQTGASSTSGEASAAAGGAEPASSEDGGAASVQTGPDGESVGATTASTPEG